MSRGLIGAILLLSASPAAGEAVAFTGATVYPVSGPPVEGAVMVVEGDTIVALGPEVEVPAGARVVELDGRRLYPAFLHPYSALGLTEIGSVRGTDDVTEVGDLNPHLRAEVAFHADSELLPVALSGGVLLAHVAPRGGLFAGSSALMRLEGWNWEEMALAAPVGMHLDFPRQRPPTRGFPRTPAEEVETERERLTELLEETVARARAYGKARRAAAAGQAPAADFDPRLEALLPVLDGELPLFLHAAEKTQIEKALEWVRKEELARVVLVTGADVQYAIEAVQAAGVPVLLNGVLARPRRDWEPYDAAFVAAARLHEAGVPFAIGDGGSRFDASNARNLPFHAAMAAAFGLPPEVALRSVTLSVAELLGVAGRLGSLEPGKEATFIVTDGDPLEIRTRILGAWMAGRELDLEADRQKRLYRRYRDRPAPAPANPKTEDAP